MKLTDSNQINPNNITWGYRGGRLDINGSNIEFSRLNASDYGAIIENGSSYKSTLTLNLKAINPDDIIVKMNQMDFRGGNGTPGELYLDKDTGRYYILKKNTYSPAFSLLMFIDAQIAKQKDQSAVLFIIINNINKLNS